MLCKEFLQRFLELLPKVSQVTNDCAARNASESA